MTNKEIGIRIKIAREKRNLNKKELAQLVNVADSTIKRYEDGEILKIKIPVIESIANALSVNPLWLIGKTDTMDIHKSKPLKILDYYNSLNDIGKHEATKRVKELTHLPQYSLDLQINAAHADESIVATPELIQAEEDIMDDENF